ncbi:TRAP transporter small permease [Geosporobacter ferrireducens]|uniref:TRAP transporter small permease n=1 Tax=Geosporobacter ferrireducens TaxID=1424294 RepID=UPI00139EEAF7|nr:TRAP transporter small permease subunit [Geosporobacter ferrireducens]MTI58076.1 TRAP transporter small permease subunit [Geosporobacter ferrireducens]
MLNKIAEKINKALHNLCKLLLLIQVIVVSYVVYGRFILNKTPAWGEPTVLLLMVWYSLLSTAIAIRDDAHIRMNIIDMILPEKGLKFLEKFNYLIIFVFSIFMIIQGYKVSVLASMSVLPGLYIRTSWLFGAVPVAGVFMVIALLGKVRKMI